MHTMVAQRMRSESCSRSDRIVEALIGSQNPKSSNQLGSALYNLTLDEVQNQLGDMGKPLSSMNLGEFLKCVFTAEANHGVNSGSNFNQPSTPVDLSKKTLDEVWRDIQRGEKREGELEQRMTLGKMILEDFLTKAGVVAESNISFGPLGLPQWMNYPIPLLNSEQLQNMAPVFAPSPPVHQQGINPPSIDGALTEPQMLMSPSPLMSTLLDTETPGCKSVAPDDTAEKSVERRQKRMIKNRESAARSRARKQAYTHELELKVSRLEEDNVRLKRRKASEKLLPVIPLLGPKYQLRRTRSGPT